MLTPFINNEGLEVVEYWEFFPISYSPFGYNETIANDYFPLMKKEILYKWHRYKEDEEGAKYYWPKIQIPDSIQDVEDTILQSILECECCSKNYKIVWPELTFYRKQNFPIPRNCPNCRCWKRMDLPNLRELLR